MALTTTKLVLALILLTIFSGFANAQNSELQATVKALQGAAQTLSGAEPTQEELRAGSPLTPWDSVSVGEKSKLLLSWENGLFGSIGELSDMSFAPEEMQGQDVPSIQITDGIFRFTTQQNRISFFSVNTPLVSIYPATDGPADFSVEVYTPESTLVTVLSGQVTVRKLNGAETIVPPCHNILIEEGKDTSGLVAIQPEDIKRLVEATTIPGTIVANLNQCGIPPTAEAVPVEPPQIAIAPDYYIEDWGGIDEYPFPEVSVLPPANPEADWIAVIPGIGRFVINIPFAVDPAIVNIYIQDVFFQRGVFFCRDYLAGLRLRQRELTRLVHLARMTGNINLLRETQRRLDDLAIRANWGAGRVNRLDHRLVELQRQHGNLSARLPRDADLSGIISASLNSPANSAAERKFQDRLHSDINVQTRLANMAGQEIGNLRQRIANEPNLGKRLAMRQELSRIQGDVASGKALIPRNQGQVDALVKQLVKTQDPDKRGQLENQLAGQLKRYETPESGDFATRELASVKRDLNKIPNQQGREVFQKRAAALEQSINARRQAESNAEQTQKNMEDLSKQVATERNPEKRNELLGRLNDLTKTLSGPASLQFLEKLKQSRPPAVQTEPRAITGTPEIQKPLERQPLERARQQHQMERPKQTEQQLQQRQLERPNQVEKRQQELQRKQTRQQELRQQQMLERQKGLQQQTRPQDLRQRQLEGVRQPGIRQQELQKQQTGRQDLRQQQLLERQRDTEKRQLELPRQQTRPQELQQRQLERQKQQGLQREQPSRERAVRSQQMLEQQHNQQIQPQHVPQQVRPQQLPQQLPQQVRPQQLPQQLQHRQPPQALPRQLPKKPEDERKLK